MPLTVSIDQNGVERVNYSHRPVEFYKAPPLPTAPRIFFKCKACGDAIIDAEQHQEALHAEASEWPRCGCGRFSDYVILMRLE